MTDEELIAALRALVEEVHRHEKNNTRNAGTDTNCRWFLREHGTALIEALSPAPVGVTGEMVGAAKRIRDTAMEQTMAARIPESGHFGAIAQDADWLVDHLTACQQEVERLRERSEKFKWQVRDTCRRAEAAEARNAELVKALNQIDALDPEEQLFGVSHDACRGLIARMGEIARAALGGQSNEA